MKEYVDMETSKQLVSAGMPQEAEKWRNQDGKIIFAKDAYMMMNISKYYPTYSLGQLLEALPEYIEKNNRLYILDESFVDSLAEMILHLRLIGFVWEIGKDYGVAQEDLKAISYIETEGTVESQCICGQDVTKIKLE